MGGVDERAIFVAGPVVVFQWRNEPGWPVDYVSPNAAGVFGWTAEQFVHGEVAYGDLIERADAARVGHEVAAATESGIASFVHEPYRIRHKEGGVRWLYDFTNVLRDPSGRATHYLGYVIDITDRVAAEDEARELERRLLHAQKLESLGVLAGGVAHDFNNLLAGIVGQASLARRALVQQRSDPLEHVAQIEVLATRAAELTRRLLAYSGRGRFVVQPTDLGELLREMARMLAVVVSKRTTLELAIAGTPVVAEVDATQIRQVVMNLITNASEALGGRAGTVTLRSALREISAPEPAYQATLAAGRYATLEVSDTGCGMDDAVLARLFDPFFTTKDTGRGLGMSAVLGIVRGHRGAVRVRSAPGGGTTFEVWLPASAQPDAALPMRAEGAGAWRGAGTILVVDDEPEVRETTAALARELGFETIVACDGGEAVELHRAHGSRIVLVLCDVTMPVMDGPETLRALREIDPRVRVLLTSGWSVHDALIPAPDAGMTAFLQKPFDLDALASAIRTLLDPG